MSIITQKNVVNGSTFELDIIRLERGSWFYRLCSVDGNPVSDLGSDPVSTERECRRQARRFAKSAVYTRGLGYHSP